jgi:sec-independent protein translocase protein TatC
MDEEKQGAPPPQGEGLSEVHEVHRPPFPAEDAPPAAYSELPPEPSTSTALAVQSGGGALTPPPPPSPPVDPEDQEEEGMLRMSFMEHLEELRSRIIKALYGLGLAFVFALVFAGKLWDIISDPAVEALKHLGVNPPRLAQLTPMESFSIIWVQLPLLCSVFLASPWIVYQVWAFISPGLYKRERNWALPFVLLTAGLFISGGLFAYFLAFRFGLEFLLGIGMSNNVQPVVSITEYFDLFVNVTLGVGLVFELPVLIFLLTLLRILSPRFLLRHSRYAILAIVIIAAIITPTPDVFNLMLFAIPMCALYFVGIFFAYQLVLKREGKKFPWMTVIAIVVGVALIVAAIYFAFTFFHLHVHRAWPYVTR